MVVCCRNNDNDNDRLVVVAVAVGNRKQLLATSRLVYAAVVVAVVFGTNAIIVLGSERRGPKVKAKVACDCE